MTVELGDGVLDWMLRRHESTFRVVDSDLVLVCEQPVLKGLGSSLVHGGQRWAVARARGELSLRRALLDAERAIVVVPQDMSLALDVSERTYLRRPLLVEAADVVAAITHRFCQRIQDASLADAVLAQATKLVAKELWPDGGAAITEADVRRGVLRVCLGIPRDLERTAPSDLLAGWLIDSLPRKSPLVTDALRRTHRLEGAWLAEAVENGVGPLITAGALAGTERARSEVPVQPTPSNERDWLSLRSLVEPAIRRVAEQAPERLEPLLEQAEAAASKAGLSPTELGRHPLLKEPLEVALARHAAAAAALEPVDESELERLRKNIHARAREDLLELVATATRLARFVRDFTPPGADADVEAWAKAHRDEVAWADMTARQLRRLSTRLGGDMVRHARTLQARYLEARDAHNASFASKLAQEEVHAFRSGALRDALPLHLVTRTLVRPLAQAGERVLLLVLDGCDLSTLLEMLLAKELYKRRMGLALPARASGTLRSDLEQRGALFTALAPLPTVTSHARRALFAGELPGNPALDAPEAASANASADRAAWAKNPALDGIERQLLLKGDLGADGEAVVAALKAAEVSVLGVVFNGVDDALSSKETTAMGPWRLASAGAGLRHVVEVAVESGWVVIITADHGHTPFWRTDRKVAPRGAQRYADKSLDGSVEFGSGPLRKSSVHLLTDVGAFVGAQRRGFHGGAGLEEVVVPIAFIGKPQSGDGLPTAPVWWSGTTARDNASRATSAPSPSSVAPPSAPFPSTPPPPSRAPSAPPDAGSNPAWLTSVKLEYQQVVMHLHLHGVVTEAEVAEMTGSPRATRRFPRELDKLASVLPWRYEVETIGSVKRFLRKGSS